MTTDPADSRPDDGQRWFTVTVTCSPDSAEVLADVLWQRSPPAVEERAVVGSDLVVLLAGYPDETVARQAAEALSATGATGIVSVTVTAVDDHGLDNWRDHVRVEQAGPFTLVPAWLPAPAPARAGTPGDDVVLRIDPGRTFGSGSHPTTRLVLAALAGLVQPGHSVLDVGCGSGILSVAAAMLGAEVVGIDIDPAAAEVVAANAEQNGVDNRVRFDPRPLADLARSATRDRAPAQRQAGEVDRGRFELVLANLLSPIVVDLASDLAAVVAPGGHLIVSGLLASRQGPARSALDATGFLELTAEAEDDGWVALTWSRSS